MEYADREYRMPAAALQKLKTARSAPQSVYLYGSTGYGKTELVRRYLDKRRHCWICCGEPWDSGAVPAETGGRRSRHVVVIDDLHLLRCEEQRQTVLDLFTRTDVWLILISRSPIPSWLMPAYIQHGLIVIGEEDLRLTEKEIATCLEEQNIPFSPDTPKYLWTRSAGNAYVLRHTILRMREGTALGPELEKEVRDAFVRYLEDRVMVQWDSDMLEFLMQVSVVDEFGLELAEMISGSRHVAALLERAAESGNFLTCSGGIYRLRPVLVQALRDRAVKIYGTARMKDFAQKAGLYYEMRDEIVPALRLYEASGSSGRIRELLIRNARRNPGNGYYYELRRYYLAMDEAEVERSAVLMAGMSMLCSMLMDEERSEYWYGKLKDFTGQARGGERREALSYLTYLDIGLPHRGIRGMVDIMKRVPALLFSKGISLPEFSVTSNLPSTMNGGKDFCHWSKTDQLLADTIGPLVERILGRYGKGLVKAALGESFYEKGRDNCDVLALLTQAQVESEGGVPEITFATVGLQARLYLSQGRPQAAKAALNSFEKSVREQRAHQLLPNIEALRCRLALYEGDREAVRGWLAHAPDENREFCSMERYRYLTKVRCYILEGANLEALALLEKLRLYGQKFQRIYLGMEVNLLSAVVKSRLERDWRTDLRAALETAAEYSFLRPIAEEGAAIWPLLRREEGRGLEAAWLERLRRETEAMNRRYPLYLKSGEPTISGNALAVLQMQAEGLSTTQIAVRLNITPATVKYHTQQNYRKLDASGKAEALLNAREMGII